MGPNNATLYHRVEPFAQFYTDNANTVFLPGPVYNSNTSDDGKPPPKLFLTSFLTRQTMYLWISYITNYSRNAPHCRWAHW